MKSEKNPKIAVVIPVLNEEESIAKVLYDIPPELVEQTIVVDNGSADNSAQIAAKYGAIVLYENERGYGAACLKGIDYLKKNKPPDILVFLDGDYSDYPQDMPLLIEKITIRGCGISFRCRNVS